MKLKKSKYEMILEEKDMREKGKEEKIKHIESEIQKATDKLNSASIEFEEAKNKVDSDSMISAGIKKEQAGKVLAMLKDTLKSTKAEHLFNDNESNEYIDVLISEADGLNESTVKEVSALLNKIDKILAKHKSAIDDYNTLIKTISNKGNTPYIMNHQMLLNVSREINRDHENFKQYF